MLAFDPREAKVPSKCLHITTKFKILGKLNEGSNSFVMDAPHMLHLFNIPTELKSMMHLKELGRQYRWWLQG